MIYLRYQAVRPGRTGLRAGVFGLVNGLYKGGGLTAEQAALRRSGNDWYETNLTDPGKAAPEVYDKALHPHAAAWFKESAAEMLERAAGYLEILDAHGVAWVLVRTAEPGLILYEDVHQVVAEPLPLSASGAAPYRTR